MPGQVVGTISIKVTPDTKHFRRELKAELEAIEKEIEGKVKVKADFDPNGLKEKVAAAAKAAKAEVPIKADTKSLDLFQKRMLAELAKAHQGLDAKIPLDVDGEKLRRKLAAEVFLIEKSIRAKIPVHLELAAGQRAKIAAEIAGLSALAAGEKAGISFTRDFAQTVSKLGSNALGSLGNIRAFGIGLAGLVAITSLVAPGIALISGLLVALPGIAAAAAAPIAALVLGFKGIGDALVNSGLAGKDKKGKMTIGPQLKSLMDQVGGVFEKGLTPVFKQVTDKLFPALGAVVPKVADGLVNVAKSFTDVVTQGRGLESIKNIFTNIGDSITRSAPGIATFTQGLLTLADKLTAKFPGLADSFSRMGDKFLGWVDKITTPNAQGISQFDTAMHNLKGTLSEISGLIGDIFSWGWENLGGADFGAKIKDFAKDLRGLITETLPALNKSMEGMGMALKPMADILGKLNTAGNWIGKVFGAFNPHGEDKKPFLQQDIGQQLMGGLGHNFENQLKEWLNPGSTQQIISEGLTPGAAAAGTEAGAAAGQNMTQGLQQALSGAGKPGVSSLQGMLDSLSQGASTPGDPKGLLGLPSPEELASKYAGVAGQIQTTFASIGPQVQAAMAQVQPALDGVKQGLTETFNNIGPLITTGLTSAIPQIVQSFGQIGQTIGQQFGAIVPQAQAAFDGVKQAISTGMQAMLAEVQSQGQAMVSEVGTWPGRFQAALGDLTSIGVSAGQNLGAGLAQGIRAGQAQAVAAATELANAVRAATEGALGIHSPSKVFHDIGSYSAQGFQEGLEGGFQGVIQRAKGLADELAGAMKDGVVPPGLKDQLKLELKELGLEYQNLKVQKDALDPKDKAGRQAISEQMKQVQTIKDQLGLQSKQLGFSDEYNKDQFDINKLMGEQLTKMIDIGKSFGMANLSQFEQDLGISGNGAIPTIANLGIGWLSQTLSGLVSGGFGGQGAGGVTFNVGNMDEALTGWQNMRNKQALQYAGR